MATDRRRGPAPARRGPAPVDRERLIAVLEPVVTAARLDLEDVEVRSAGRRRIVRVLVDGDRGVSLDEVAQVSRAVSDVLDESDVLGEQPYTLEVSSPGVDRPLTLPRHWRRNVGRLVQVTLQASEPVLGRIAAVADDGVELDLPSGRRHIGYAQVARAVVQVEFREVEADEVEGEGADDEAAGGEGADGETAGEEATWTSTSPR